METWRRDALTGVHILSVCQITLSINVIVFAAADAFCTMMFVEQTSMQTQFDECEADLLIWNNTLYRLLLSVGIKAEQKADEFALMMVMKP